MNAREIFDRLLALPVPRRLQPFFTAHREKLLYLFFGGISFLLSMGSYAVCLNLFCLRPIAATLLSWIVTVAFVYASNRRWVFRAERKRGAKRRRQILAFYAGRTVTLLAEETIMAVFAIYLGLPGIPVKAAAQVIAILLNYIISKKLIFNGQR